MIADSTVMVPNEERLSNLIQSFPKLRNGITEYLQAKPDDSEAEGRLKNALEGLMVGLVAEPFMRSLRLLKYARIRLPIVEVRTKRHYELEAIKVDNNGEYSGKLVPRELGNGADVRKSRDAQTTNVIKEFNQAEIKIINEAQNILDSKAMSQIQQAHISGQPVTVVIYGRTIKYEPNLPASGMTMFGENGFLIGKEAFKSKTELQKTILHELHRLNTSSSASGVSGSLAAEETKAAFDFSEKASNVLRNK